MRWFPVKRNGSFTGQAILLLTICCFLNAAGLCQDRRYTFTEPKMGSPFTITFYCGDSTAALQIAGKSFALADSLIEILSDYLDSSELNRLCARAGRGFFPCSPVLYRILRISKRAYEQSDGKFDISLGALTRLWRSARRKGSFPDSAEVTRARSLTGFRHLSFDTLRHAVAIDSPGIQIDLGGIGQGFIAAAVSEFLTQQPIANALVDVSGDIVATGQPPGAAGWTIGINVPEEETRLLSRRILIKNKAVTTSGDVYQFMLHDGRKYSHIIDPATGYGITTQRNVTVIAADGTTADWFTKACSLLPLYRVKKLARRLNAAFLITEIKHGRISYERSRSFARYWKK